MHLILSLPAALAALASVSRLSLVERGDIAPPPCADTLQAALSLSLSCGVAYAADWHGIPADVIRAERKRQAAADAAEHKRLAETGRKEELRAIAAEDSDNATDARKSLEAEARDFGRVLARDLMTAEKDG